MSSKRVLLTVPPRASHLAGTRLQRHSPHRAFSSNTSAKDAAARMLDTFKDQTITQRQLIDANQLQKLALTLGHSHLPTPSGLTDITATAPPKSTPIPPGWHLVYFTATGLETQLGHDGSDVTFNAPAPFTRRMWAGGSMQWGDTTKPCGELRVGDVAEERTTLVSATAKKSRSGGEMVLVEVEKEIFTEERGLVIRDRRNWIFRPEVGRGDVETPKALEVDKGPSMMKDVQGQHGYPTRHLRWSPVGLFRFSALTFNGHKIHYNEDWTRTVEGHPGVVVHGPLNLINMLDYWRDVHGKKDTQPMRIEYRAMSPLYAGEEYHIRTERVDEGGQCRLVVEREGVVCMKGSITAGSEI